MCISSLQALTLALTRRAIGLHRDERGTMSIVSVFALMFLAMLLGMVMNAGRQVDGKIRMQVAADSAAYSGGVVLARGMNSLAFTNHLLCDVFAVTAFLREARDQNSASYAPNILAAWNKVAGQFTASGFPKFTALGSAIQQKTPLEQKMVTKYSDWAKSVSDQVLPMMEEILSDELIPKYQRAVVAAFPDIAQSAARETAARNGDPDHGRGTMYAALWASWNGHRDNEVGGPIDDRTMPVVDPEMDSVSNQEEYVHTAQGQRYVLSHKYLNDWNNEALVGFDLHGKMSQFANLWRSFTCGYLDHLLNVEYPNTNLPMVIRDNPGDASNPTDALQKNYTFVSVVYWKKLPEMLPGLFRNPLEADSQAFAEVHLFVPRPRLGWIHEVPNSSSSPAPQGAVPGEQAFIGGDSGAGQTGTTQIASSSAAGRWVVGRVGSPSDWNLLNQSWTCQLAPVSAPWLATVLQSNPQLADFDAQDFKLPNLGGMTSEQLQKISPH
jgi:hypothetical protein